MWPPALTAAGAIVVATWAGGPGIGWWDDEHVVLAGWPDGAWADAPGARLRATARPNSIESLAPGERWSHRFLRRRELTRRSIVPTAILV